MSGNWSYQVFVDTSFHPSQGNFGHAYVNIAGPNGQNYTVGYYPNVTVIDTNGLPGSSGGHVYEGSGEIRNDAQTGRDANGNITQHPYDFSTDRRVMSTDTALKMLSYIDQVNKNPGIYGVAGNNCVGFVNDLMTLNNDGLNITGTAPTLFKIALTAQQNLRDSEGSPQGDPFTGMPWPGGTAGVPTSGKSTKAPWRTDNINGLDLDPRH
jgi:hypothetical protein